MANVRMNWRGAQAKAAVRKGASRGLALAAEHVLEEATRIVPIEEGTLERSGSTGVDGLKAAVSFAGPYAVRQHEDLTYRHDQGRQAKYLETPLMTERDVVGKVVQREIKKELK